MSVSPFDHALLSGLLGDDEVSPFFSADSEIQHMLRFEEALALAEAQEGVVPSKMADGIVEQIQSFVPNYDAIRRATQRDGVIGVEFVRQLRDALGAPLDQYVHFGATSQDLVDSALVLRLRPVLHILEQRIVAIRDKFADLNQRFGERRVMGRTRMQDALPIAVREKLATWDGPLERHLARLAELRPRLMVLQFGGAAGTLDKLGDRAEQVCGRLAEALDLAPARSWHSQRDTIVELAGWLSQVAGSLGKAGADIGLMAQNRFGEVALEGGGGSSAMPHKHNPVGAEVLVALAHFNATQISGMHSALVHEQERSGAAWTLEWLILPQMVVATAASLRTALTLLSQINRIGDPT
ncbi:MAG: 3-carboxy-cis,cis-muconate cycloisomerase [Devosia sp.]|jgi:3-carboxy-cis,cis-muconate cycloisomerase